MQAGEDAQMCSSPDQVSQFESFQEIGRLHRSAAEELDVDQSIFLPFLDELEKLLVGICLMNELTPRAKDYLVSFGERMSTRLFAAYLQSKGVRSKQYVKETKKETEWARLHISVLLCHLKRHFDLREEN